MAPTFRPYQSVGQGLNQLNLPQGLEAQEAQRTMTVLSRSLDQMATFTMRQAESLAKEEGSKFGVENAPSVDTLTKAFKDGRDTSDLLEFGNTVFGRSARESALRVLQNEAMVEGTKIINDLVFTASSNNTPPPTLQNQINSSILGLSDAITASSPELGEIIKSKLLMQGIGEFDRYRTAFAKGSVGQAGAVGRANVNAYLNNLPSTLTAILNKPDMTPELFSKSLQDAVKSGIVEFATNGYAKTQLESKINEQDEIIKNWILSQFTQEVFERDITEPNPAYTPMLLLRQIEKGVYKGDDPQAKVIVDYLNLKNKGGVRVPTLKELMKSVTDNYNSMIALENNEINIANKRMEENKKSQVLILDNIFNKTSPLTDTDVANARTAIAQLEKMQFSSLVDQYTEQLETLSVDNSFPPSSSGDAILEVEALLRGGRINFGLLNRYRKSLSREQYNDYFEKVVSSLDERTARAIDKIKVAVGMDYKTMQYGDLKQDAKYEYRKAQIAEGKLLDAMSQSRLEGTEVNPLEIVKSIIEEANFATNEEIRKDNLKKAMRSVNGLILQFNAIAEDTGFDEGAFRGQTDEQTVSNWLSIIRNWTDFQNIDQVPAQYRTPLIKEWFKDGKWQENIEKQIRKMQRALPSG